MNLVPVKAAEAPRKFDLAIIGAGPSGMAAAITARECGLSVLVVDENAAPGGQVFRAAELVGKGFRDAVLALQRSDPDLLRD
jgi:flavin-dependent dehydrogenase